MPHIRIGAACLTVLLPLIERSYLLLPIAPAVREDALPGALLAALVCVVGGYATASYSDRGLDVGWTAMVLFLATLVAIVAFLDLIPRGERSLYIMAFAFFSLSVSSFLCLRRGDPYLDGVQPSWP